MTTKEKIEKFTDSFIPWWDRDDNDMTNIDEMLSSRKGRRDLYEFFRMFAEDNLDWQEAFESASDIILDLIEIERRHA